jgi:L-2-hydroxyglutarate oxidase LhgO
MCDEIINTAGLFAPQVAYRMGQGIHPNKSNKSIHLESIPKPFYSKGNYFKLVSKTQGSFTTSTSTQQQQQQQQQGKFQRLIYPMPSGGGLGVHATIDLSGAIRFGPDTQWIPNNTASSKSSDASVDPYAFNLEDPLDLQHSLSSPSMSSGKGELNYQVSLSSETRDAFMEAIARYWPAVRDYDLVPDYCGIRPKLCGPTSGNSKESNKSNAGQYKMAAAVDFVIHDASIHGLKNVVHLYGIESPGWTSSLALADHVVKNYILNSKI